MAGWLVVAWLGALVAVGWLRGWVGLALLAGDSYGIGNWFDILTHVTYTSICICV